MSGKGIKGEDNLNHRRVAVLGIRLMLTLVKGTSPTEGVGDLWSRWANMLIARDDLAAVVVGGKIYAIGRRSGNNWCATVENYDSATDSCCSRTPMPSARDDLAVVTVGGMIYTIGSFYGNALSSVEEYDPPFYNTDEDGISDNDKLHSGTNPLLPDAAADTDGDGLMNLEEVDTYSKNQGQLSDVI